MSVEFDKNPTSFHWLTFCSVIWHILIPEFYHKYQICVIRLRFQLLNPHVTIGFISTLWRLGGIREEFLKNWGLTLAKKATKNRYQKMCFQVHDVPIWIDMTSNDVQERIIKLNCRGDCYLSLNVFINTHQNIFL